MAGQQFICEMRNAAGDVWFSIVSADDETAARAAAEIAAQQLAADALGIPYEPYKAPTEPVVPEFTFYAFVDALPQDRPATEEPPPGPG